MKIFVQKQPGRIYRAYYFLKDERVIIGSSIESIKDAVKKLEESFYDEIPEAYKGLVEEYHE